jgi:hypothetical protein
MDGISGPVEQARRGVGLWHHRDFLKLWAGESVSLFGSQVTELALPLVAIYTLRANAAQLGLLNAARFVSFLLVTLPAGVVVDRRRRRPILIGSNLGRAVLIGLIPLLAAAHWLRMPYLYVLAAFVLNGVGLGLTNVYAISLRQTSTPDELLGRVNASWCDRRAGWRRAWRCGGPPFGAGRLCHRGNAVAAAGGVLAAAQAARTAGVGSARVRISVTAATQERGRGQWLSKGSARSYRRWKQLISSVCASMAQGALPGKRPPPRHCGKLAWQRPCRSAPA